MIYTTVKVMSWIYVFLLPVALAITYFFTLVASLFGFGDMGIVAGVLLAISFIVSTWKVFALLREQTLDGRIVHWLTVGIGNWLVLIGFILYRYFFGDCCL